MKLNSIEQGKIDAMDKMLDGVFVEEMFNKYIEKKDSEIVSLKNELIRIEGKKSNNSDSMDIRKMKVILDEALSFETLSRATLVKFVDKVLVREDSTVEIVYRFSSIQKEIVEMQKNIS